MKMPKIEKSVKQREVVPFLRSSTVTTVTHRTQGLSYVT